MLFVGLDRIVIDDRLPGNKKEVDCGVDGTKILPILTIFTEEDFMARQRHVSNMAVLIVTFCNGHAILRGMAMFGSFCHEVVHLHFHSNFHLH